jgi:xylan 1,4-beta-xylosidase
MANQNACFRGVRSRLIGASFGLLLLCGTAANAATFQNPVLPGDYPDPSVIRVGDEYWATATSSEWAPLFPLLKSRDLVNWEWVGNVFERRPEWAVGRFWAPEIWEHKGKFYIYYVGLKRGGSLAVAVATADKPAGPWTDHGPMVSQEMGSIDAMPVADNDGTLYLMWKEDGNSRNKPTPIWIQKMTPDGTKLVGEMKEILRNDADWERNLVEGPYVQRQGDYWYMFYSGNGCCGRGCNYALGVARAKNLMGPWEKCPSNPLVVGNDTWKCPGHGSVVRDPEGRDWLLYHAYHADTFVYVGRQGVLDPVTWKDGWPVINEGKGTGTKLLGPTAFKAQQPLVDFSDDFKAAKLSPQWQWPQDVHPTVVISDGKLKLSASARRADPLAGAVIAVRTTVGDYVATTSVDLHSVAGNRSAGLSAFGDHDNALGASVKDGKVLVWKRQRGKEQMLSTNATPAGQTVHLRMTAAKGHRFSFSTSGDGKTWTELGGKVDVEGNYLPPWDRGIRVALVAGGESPEAVFGPVRVAQTQTK